MNINFIFQCLVSEILQYIMSIPWNTISNSPFSGLLRLSWDVLPKWIKNTKIMLPIWRRRSYFSNTSVKILLGVKLGAPDRGLEHLPLRHGEGCTALSGVGQSKIPGRTEVPHRRLWLRAGLGSG